MLACAGGISFISKKGDNFARMFMKHDSSIYWNINVNFLIMSAIYEPIKCLQLHFHFSG